MKLSKEIKDKIDKYFDSIVAKDLFEIAQSKYGFTQSNIDIENQRFSTRKKSYYATKNSSYIITEDENNETFPFAA